VISWFEFWLILNEGLAEIKRSSQGGENDGKII